MSDLIKSDQPPPPPPRDAGHHAAGPARADGLRSQECSPRLRSAPKPLAPTAPNAHGADRGSCSDSCAESDRQVAASGSSRYCPLSSADAGRSHQCPPRRRRRTRTRHRRALAARRAWATSTSPTPRTPAWPRSPSRSTSPSRRASPTALVQFCEKHNIGLVVIGPEEPLAEGLADKLRRPNRLVFGPTRRRRPPRGRQGLGQAAHARPPPSPPPSPLFTDAEAARHTSRPASMTTRPRPSSRRRRQVPRPRRPPPDHR